MAVLVRPVPTPATQVAREEEVEAEAQAPLQAPVPTEVPRAGQVRPVPLSRDVAQIAALATVTGFRVAAGHAAVATRARLGLGRRLALPAKTPVVATVVRPAVVGRA